MSYKMMGDILKQEREADYYIVSYFERDEETGKQLYWSNDDGWVDKASATVYSYEERMKWSAPVIDGYWTKG